MKSVLLVFTAVCMLMFFSCEKERITGSGNIITKQLPVDDFTKVISSGSTDVFISQGTTFTVELKGYGNLMPYFEAIVTNGVLHLGYKNNVNVRNDNIDVFITMPVLNGAEISGSAAINATGDFGNTQTFDTKISGSGRIHISQMAVENLNSTISGSGSLSLFGITAKNAEINISGSGKIETRVTQSLNAQISGSGNIYYKGNPSLNVQVSGSGKVIDSN